MNREFWRDIGLAVVIAVAVVCVISLLSLGAWLQP
jgi:hypothetical protein